VPGPLGFATNRRADDPGFALSYSSMGGKVAKIAKGAKGTCGPRRAGQKSEPGPRPALRDLKVAKVAKIADFIGIPPRFNLFAT
jgi:hypothetical protein